MLLPPLPILLLFGGITACSGKTCPEPLSEGPIVAGDANGDGAVDLADGAWLQRWLFRGGDPPVCEAAADVVPDGTVDAGDAVAIWSRALAGAGAFPALADDACAAGTRDEARARDRDACARTSLRVEVPKRTGGEVEATVFLRSPDRAVEGWQLAIAAEGCAIVEASLAGTAGAPLAEGGSRGQGYALAELVEGGAVAAVLLDWMTGATLPASKEEVPLLRLRLDAELPDRGCATCALRFRPELPGPGEPVRTMVSREGRAFLPRTQDAKVRFCAP